MMDTRIVVLSLWLGVIIGVLKTLKQAPAFRDLDDFIINILCFCVLSGSLGLLIAYSKAAFNR